MTWSTESHASLAAVQYLAAQGQGTAAVDLFVDFMPESPDVITAVLQYGAPPAQHINFLSQGSAAARLSLYARGAPDDADAARARIWAAYSALLGAVEVTQGSVTIINLSPAGDPELLEHDDRHRAVFVANIDVVYRLT